MGLSDFCTELSRLELGLSESSEPFSVSHVNTHAQSHNLKLTAKRPSLWSLAFQHKTTTFHSARQNPLIALPPLRFSVSAL